MEVIEMEFSKEAFEQLKELHKQYEREYPKQPTFAEWLMEEAKREKEKRLADTQQRNKMNKKLKQEIKKENTII